MSVGTYAPSAVHSAVGYYDYVEARVLQWGRQQFVEFRAVLRLLDPRFRVANPHMLGRYTYILHDITLFI